jgi:hypothetical protein
MHVIIIFHIAPHRLYLQANVTLPELKGKGPQEVCFISKATDASYNTQPDSVAGVWNLRGVVNNAWHKVSVSVSS